MTFAEAARIMMSGSPVMPVIEPLVITSNGKYTAPVEVDGFNPVIVNVPDRYDEGYAAAKAKIIPLTVTGGGTYYAENYGALGFDPVNAEIVDRLKIYLNNIIQTADSINETGNGTIDNVNPDDLGTVTGPLFGSRTVKEVHIQCPDTGYTIVVGVRYNNSPPKMQRFGYTIDPDGNKILPWSGGIATNYDYNARVVSVKWVTDTHGVRRLHVEYYAEKSDGSGKTFTDVQTYNKKIYGTGNQNVSIVGPFAYDTASWSTMFSLIMNTLNGKTMKVLLDNESVLDPETNTYSPSWYYEGLITIDNWKTGDKYSTITIAYDLKPYKYSYGDPTIKSL